jgi:hypothetical protein
MSYTDVQSPQKSPSRHEGLQLPPIGVKTYLNSPIETPSKSPRVGLDMSLI